MLMWHDQNPYIEYRHCNFCNEMFMPGEYVYCHECCENRRKDTEHYFHVICQEILNKNYVEERQNLQSDFCELTKQYDEYLKTGQ